VIGDGEPGFAAVTENFSSAGILLYAGQLIQVGSRVGLLLVVPSVEPEMENRRMWCFGKVVRVEKALKEGKFGMAIGFQSFEEASQA